MIVTKDQLLIELYHCAIKQGYGIDLSPLYSKPQIDFALHIKLKELLNEID
jgi:hypothetical protein